MRRTTEFATWLAARWPVLVRTAVFLGHRQPEAERIAEEALARLLPTWERETREGDVDVLAFRALLEQRARVLRQRGHRGHRHAHDADDLGAETDQPDQPDLPPGLGDRLERRRELERHLATLPEDERVRAVLTHVAGLSADEVDDVLDRPAAVPGLPLGPAEVRDACEAVPAPPAPVAGVVERSRRRRRTTLLRAGTVLGGAVVVLLATTWWTSGEDRPPQGEVSAATNPLPVPWFADGRLHLARVEVRLSGVRQLLDVPDGVVVTDDDGRVLHVDEQGRQRVIGDTVTGSRLAVESELGWVAWADPGDGDPELVVHDTLRRVEVGRRSLAGSGSTGGQPVGRYGPIAIDEERVYYRSPDGDFAWEPAIDVSFALAGTLVDTADQARVTRSEGVLRLTPLPYRTGTPIDADEAQLTQDGRYAFATKAASLDRMSVYDVETGRPTDRMISPSDHAVSWTYLDGTFVFAALHKLQDKTYQDMLQMPSEGDYRLYACRLGRPEPCDKLGEIPEEVADPPVFPQ